MEALPEEAQIKWQSDKENIITHYALAYNAKAKPIMSFFKTFEEQFGKLWQSYCGNNPNNRPRRLKNLNRNQYPTFEEWKEIHEAGRVNQ